MPKIELDTTCANKAIIYFGSEILLSLFRIIQVLIPIGTTNFHVINISILCLHYLKDINILGIYLNNITN